MICTTTNFLALLLFFPGPEPYLYTTVKVAGIAFSNSCLKAVLSPATKIFRATRVNILVASPSMYLLAVLYLIAMSRRLKAAKAIISALYLFSVGALASGGYGASILSAGLITLVQKIDQRFIRPFLLIININHCHSCQQKCIFKLLVNLYVQNISL
jgi:hypothetical protein